MARLDQQQFGALHTALLEAFETRDSLELLVLYAHDKRLDQMVLGDTLYDVVARIIRRAEEESWVDQLIKAAHELRPGHPEIARLAERFR